LFWNVWGLESNPRIKSRKFQAYPYSRTTDEFGCTRRSSNRGRSACGQYHVGQDRISRCPVPSETGKTLYRFGLAAVRASIIPSGSSPSRATTRRLAVSSTVITSSTGQQTQIGAGLFEAPASHRQTNGGVSSTPFDRSSSPALTVVDSSSLVHSSWGVTQPSRPYRRAPASLGRFPDTSPLRLNRRRASTTEYLSSSHLHSELRMAFELAGRFR
jgi:hypothetical protein